MVYIKPLMEQHLFEITKLEKECFTIPWTYAMFESELKSPLANYYIASVDGYIVGYAGMLIIIDEGHITNIAVKKEYRNKKIGSLLLEKLIEVGNEFHLKFLTLEVRKSNSLAIHLYEKFGFKKVGIRKEYYTDNKEDAIIMTLDKLTD